MLNHSRAHEILIAGVAQRRQIIDAEVHEMEEEEQRQEQQRQVLIARLRQDINVQHENGLFLLCEAVNRGDARTVELLLQLPGITNRSHWEEYYGVPTSLFVSPLMDAAQAGFTEIVALLLQMPDINVNARNFEGNAALTLAENNGHFATARLLRQYGARDGESVASRLKRYFYIGKVFIRRGLFHDFPRPNN